MTYRTATKLAILVVLAGLTGCASTRGPANDLESDLLDWLTRNPGVVAVSLPLAFQQATGGVAGGLINREYVFTSIGVAGDIRYFVGHGPIEASEISEHAVLGQALPPGGSLQFNSFGFRDDSVMVSFMPAKWTEAIRPVVLIRVELDTDDRAFSALPEIIHSLSRVIDFGRAYAQLRSPYQALTFLEREVAQLERKYREAPEESSYKLRSGENLLDLLSRQTQARVDYAQAAGTPERVPPEADRVAVLESELAILRQSLAKVHDEFVVNVKHYFAQAEYNTALQICLDALVEYPDSRELRDLRNRINETLSVLYSP
jgi:hypothetical protein